MIWLDSLSLDDANAVRALVDSAAFADQGESIDAQALRSLTASDSAARHLLHREDGRIVGYANLFGAHVDHPAMAEVVVLPEARGRGIGTALVQAALGQGAHVWAHGDLPAAGAIARKLGLSPARELLQLRRDLSDLPELQVPQGISIRSYAGPDDDAELVRVNNAAFVGHPEQGGWTVRDIEQRCAEDWFDPAGLLIATDATGAVRGFHWTKTHTPDLGEVYVVGIDPDAQGGGLGRTLTLAGLRYLRDRGHGTVMLYTEADNVKAVRTYSGLGFQRYHSDVAYSR